jgi:dTDP-4-dehydrorhamnose 3,5-epimerase
MATSSPEIIRSDVIDGVVIVRPLAHGDDRGRFAETYRRSWFPEGTEMVQGSRSDKVAGSLVGIHYHLHQADYWYIVQGTARVVLHDLRQGSPTDGATVSFEMGDSLECGVYIPPGVGHGFAALTDVTLTYLVDQYYSPEDELGVAWDDPDIAADWGLTDPILSRRDQTNPLRADIPTGRRPLLGSPPPPIPDPALEV